jgi:FAD/FMN-containing dehydrogenase
VQETTLGPRDTGYDSARTVWNARFDRRPARVARATGAADVAAAIQYARDRDLAISVKSGGHDYAGNSACDGGLLIDLGGLDAVSVDPETRRATVGSGMLWGGLDAATQAVGLATPGGTVSSVGVAGFTLGGGQGWLTRKHGLACDNLVGAQVVTADGEVVRASANQNADLFWCLRGGGGNFGVVTSFEFSLHSLDHDVSAGQIVYPIERAGEALRFYRDFFEDAADETMCFPFFYRVPPLDVFPEKTHGDVVIAFVVAYMGPPSEGEAVLRAFADLGEPILDLVAPQPYTTLQQSFDAGMGHGNRWYSRAHDFDVLSDAAIDTLVDRLDPFPGDFTSVYLGPGGGAVARVAPDATAYRGRGATHGLHIFPGWSDAGQDSEVIEWARGVSEAISPFTSGGVYVNMLAEDEPHRIAAAYGPNLDRLQKLKAKWDPENVFRGNHNIAPAT